jgi:hypothetical protein
LNPNSENSKFIFDDVNQWNNLFDIFISINISDYYFSLAINYNNWGW